MRIREAADVPAETAVLLAAAEGAQVALILLSGSGAVLSATAAAEALARASGRFSLRQERVEWAQPEDAAAFKAARARLQESRRAYFRAGDILATLSTVAAPRSPFFNQGRGVAMQLSRLGSEPLSVAALEELFGLTPAEARLVHAFARSRDLRAAARTARVTVETARGYLKRAMQKMHCRRQGELIRRIGKG